MRVLTAIRRAPRGMWACALVAVIASWIWSVATPPFQPPDEIAHIGYVRYLGNTGRIPRMPFAPPKSPRPSDMAIAFGGVPFSLQGTPTWDPAVSRAVHHAVRGPHNHVEEGDARTAANNPPLYYALLAIPYQAVKRANLFDQMLALRLFSSLFAGMAAAFCFLFIRELVPGTPWVWTAGGMAVALQPIFGYMGGAVNCDVLLWAACAALFYASARLLRHGVTARRVAGLSLALLAGLATKGAMLGLIPGFAIVLALAFWRTPGTHLRRAALAIGAAAAAVLVPVVAWIAFTREVHGTVSGAGTTGGVAASGVGINLHTELSYIWQVYLPPLPFQSHIFVRYPLWDIYFKGFVGRFGHLAFDYPNWVEKLALVLAIIVVVLAGRAIWLARATFRRRLPELVAYVALAVGLLVLLAIAGYQTRVRDHVALEQTRYILPLIPLYGGLIALAARGSLRYGRELALVLVALAAGHEVFSVLLTIAHYYA